MWENHIEFVAERDLNPMIRGHRCFRYRSIVTSAAAAHSDSGGNYSSEVCLFARERMAIFGNVTGEPILSLADRRWFLAAEIALLVSLDRFGDGFPVLDGCQRTEHVVREIVGKRLTVTDAVRPIPVGESGLAERDDICDT